MGNIVIVGFTGEYQDPVTRAYPLGEGYRWHLDWFGRFNAQDDVSPFGVGGVNPYAYCADDPINHSDPSGHMLGSFDPKIQEISDMLENTGTGRGALQTPLLKTLHPESFGKNSQSQGPINVEIAAAESSGSAALDDRSLKTPSLPVRLRLMTEVLKHHRSHQHHRPHHSVVYRNICYHRNHQILPHPP
jgi:RHS repeat-associated protein